MAWIESHQTLVHHPKLLKLRQATGWTLNESIGAIHRLWWWTLAYAESGYLGDHAPETISLAIEARETDYYSHEILFDVLKSCRFMTENNFVHDWLDYAGRYLKTKYRTSNAQKLLEITDNFDKPKVHKKSARSQTKVRSKSDTFTYLPTYLNQPTLTNLCLALEEILTKCKGELGKHIMSQKFLESYLEWTLYKKDKKDPVTKHSIHKQFDNLAGHEVDISIKMIDNAIEKGWKGIYPLKENGTSSGKGMTAEHENKCADLKRELRIAEDSLERASEADQFTPSEQTKKRVGHWTREVNRIRKQLEG